MQKRGFTLIELLVSIVIIGLLTAVATTSFINAQRNARDDARKTSVQAIANAVEAYKLVKQVYPGKADVSDTAAGALCIADTTYYQNPNVGTTCVPATGFDANLYNPTPIWIPGLGSYINPIPQEPRYVDKDGGTTGIGSFDTLGAATAATRTYSYKRTATGYQVSTKLERTGAGTYSVGK
jgi:prepilin-type N-terminal cleavage/methylation domain-containing protein